MKRITLVHGVIFATLASTTLFAHAQYSAYDLGPGAAGGINSSGTIVGNSSASDGYSYAFSYSEGVMSDLAPYLASIGMTGSSVALAINDNGDIVGYGYKDLNYHVFLLAVPEPSALALLVLSGAALLFRRRSRLAAQ